MVTWQQIRRVQILRMLQVLTQVLADAFSARFVLMLWLARLADIRQTMLRGLADIGKYTYASFDLAQRPLI